MQCLGEHRTIGWVYLMRAPADFNASWRARKLRRRNRKSMRAFSTHNYSLARVITHPANPRRNRGMLVLFCGKEVTQSLSSASRNRKYMRIFMKGQILAKLLLSNYFFSQF
jgi:hypothetical protein